MYNPNLHKRKSIRCKNYNYAKKGAYFLTFNLKERLPILGNIENQVMYENIIGRLVKESWLMTPKIRTNVTLGAFILMPDHFHAIIHINEERQMNDQGALQKPKNTGEASNANKSCHKLNQDFKSPSQTIGAIVRGFKGSSTKLIKELTYKINEEMIDKSNESKTIEIQHPNKIDKIEIHKKDLEEIEHLIKRIDLNKSIWQRDYYDIIIRDNESLERITQYIINNPKNAHLKGR